MKLFFLLQFNNLLRLLERKKYKLRNKLVSDDWIVIKLSSLSYKIVDKINKLFTLEDKAHKNKLFSNELISFRHKEELPLINDIHDLVFNNTPKKESALESALNYTKKV